MRKHRDPEGVVRSVTITRSEWRRRQRGRRAVVDGCGRAYVWVQCEQHGRVRVRAMVVADGSPEARQEARR